MAKAREQSSLNAAVRFDLDAHLDAILRAAGSALKYYTMRKSRSDMRDALRQAIYAWDVAKAAAQPTAAAVGARALRTLIADDAWAMSFQTMGQYRSELLKLARELDQQQEAAEAAWRPIETAPATGYFLVYEDGAVRAKLRNQGKWLDIEYPFVELEPWGERLVGKEALRIIGPGKKLGVSDGCPEPTHWADFPSTDCLDAPNTPTQESATLAPQQGADHHG